MGLKVCKWSSLNAPGCETFLKSVFVLPLSPVVRVELGVRPVPLVRLSELQARAAAAAVAHVVEGVVHGGGGEGEATGT